MFPVSLSGCVYDLVVTKTTLVFPLPHWTSLYKAFPYTEYIWGDLFFPVSVYGGYTLLISNEFLETF